MIIRYDAGFPAGVERSHMVSLTDLFATICDLANVSIEDQAIDSVSFADYTKSNDSTGKCQNLLEFSQICEKYI